MEGPKDIHAMILDQTRPGLVEEAEEHTLVLLGLYRSLFASETDEERNAAIAALRDAGELA